MKGLKRTVYNVVREVLAENPMPRGAVCYTPEQISGAEMSEYRKGTIGAILPGKFFYYHGRDGQRIFKMKMLRDQGGTGRFMVAEIRKIMESHPNDEEIAENVLSRVQGGEIQLIDIDAKYITVDGKPLTKKPVWEGGR